MPNVERIYNENILAVDVALQDTSKETFELQYNKDRVKDKTWDQLF